MFTPNWRSPKAELSGQGYLQDTCCVSVLRSDNRRHMLTFIEANALRTYDALNPVRAKH
jgi:hypothetical protein